jgi:hypothetical protein
MGVVAVQAQRQMREKSLHRQVSSFLGCLESVWLHTGLLQLQPPCMLHRRWLLQLPLQQLPQAAAEAFTFLASAQAMVPLEQDHPPGQAVEA